MPHGLSVGRVEISPTAPQIAGVGELLKGDWRGAMEKRKEVWKDRRVESDVGRLGK